MPIQDDLISPQDLTTFCKFPLQFASANLLHILDGRILQQSYENEQVHLDLFEMELQAQTVFDVSISEPSICMFIPLKGHLKLKNQNEVVLKSDTASCCLFYSNAYKYQFILEPGENRILILNFNLDWLQEKVQLYGEYDVIIQHYKSPKKAAYTLPACITPRPLLRAIQRLDSKHLSSAEKVETALTLLTEQTLRIYHDLLVDQQYTINTLNQNKAKQLFKLVEMFYANEETSDPAFLAEKLFITEKQLNRICNEFHGRPARQFVIYYRLLQSLKLLMTTRKRINEIAITVGFKDPHQYTETFKTYFHDIAPSEIIRGV